MSCPNVIAFYIMSCSIACVHALAVSPALCAVPEPMSGAPRLAAATRGTGAAVGAASLGAATLVVVPRPGAAVAFHQGASAGSSVFGVT